MMTVNTTTHTPPDTRLRIEHAEPGEGYRLLGLYEVIERTDEVFHRGEWIHNGSAKAGRELLKHWRPRRRKVAVSYPRYWLNVVIRNIYCATSEFCPGFSWVDDRNFWCKLDDNGPLAQHVKRWPLTYKPITEAQAVQLGADLETLPTSPAKAARDREKSLSREELYDELINAVASKWPNETRHQTALRYIQEAESRSTKTVEPIVGIVKTLGII